MIIEKSYRDECVSPTIDVIQLIRIRRDVFSDMPNVHFDALKDKLNDDKEWEKIIESIKSDSAGDF